MQSDLDGAAFSYPRAVVSPKRETNERSCLLLNKLLDLINTINKCQILCSMVVSQH